MFAASKDGKPKSALPDLKPYAMQRVQIRLEGGRRVIGVLTGFDEFMNVVLSNAEEAAGADAAAGRSMGETVVRGSTIVNIEKL
jgi:small nuclear ribonucleoprotein G